MRRALVLCALGTLAHAEPAALPCRPTIACTADIVPPGHLELEMGFIDRVLAHDLQQQQLPFLFKLTLARWAQLQVGSNGPTFGQAAAYFDDATIGVKLHVHDQTRLVPSLSLSGTASLPTVSAPGYVRTYDAFWIAYITKDLDWLHADLNLGLNLWRLDGSPLVQPWIALALSVALGHGVGAMAEGYDFSDAAPVSARDAGILMAISYQPVRRLVLDVGPDIGLVHDTRILSLFIGATVLFEPLW
jgi:hypothetical protein